MTKKDFIKEEIKPKLDDSGIEMAYVSVSSKSLEALYNSDGSGEMTLFIDNEDFFFAEKGILPDQIKELKDYMTDLNNQMNICRNALEKLENLELPKPIKTVQVIKKKTISKEETK